MRENEGFEAATLGGGCFWCLEAVFEQLKGVASVVSGYAGGTTPDPTYKAVCSGTTGHAEVVRVTFDPTVISYRQLLDVFFVVHDPTTPNRQGNDVGTQYRSVVFTHTPGQAATAADAIRAVTDRHLWPGEVVTEVVPLTRFYPAEDYHQHYFATNPEQPYCQWVVNPKVGRARKEFSGLMK